MDRESSPALPLSLSSPRVTQGSHLFKVTGYSLSKGIGIGRYLASDTFMVGGYAWAIYFYPEGRSVEDNSYVSLFIALASEGTDVKALFELTLLDQSGKGRHKVHTHFGRRLESELYTLNYRGSMWGYKRFFKRTRLEKSDYLKDDCLSIHCCVGVVTSHTEGPKIYSIPTPPYDIGQHFGQLLESRKGTEVNFEVDGENFAAHKLVLAARSPVFKAQLLGPMGDENTQCIKIEDVEAPVFKESGLMCLDRCEGLCGQYDLDKDSLRSVVSEIKEVVEVLCESFDIVFGQTWMLCKHCNSLSTINRCATELGVSYQSIIDAIFVESGPNCILRDSEGIIGRATRSSHNLVYCENVAKFSITEYPFAHFVRKYHLSASFAICLQSNHSGDQVYVLEFFLGPSYVNWGLREKLVPILDKMRQSFQTFKVAYGGEEIGDNLFVLVVDALSPDKVETLKNEPIDLTLAIGVKNVEVFYLPYDVGESSRKETDDWMIGVETSFQDICMDDVPVASASTVQSEILVTVKANYKDDFVRFQLHASSGIHELYRQVSQRLELTEGTYDLNYLDDDNDLILLTCDEDLQFYISSSTKQGNYTLLVLIKPKCASPMLFP